MKIVSVHLSVNVAIVKTVTAKKIMKITKKMTIGELLLKKPEAAKLLMEAGMGCVGCPMAQMESIKEGCLAHGIEPEEIDKLIKKINELK